MTNHPWLSHTRVIIAIIVVVNVVFAGAWLWSRPGQTTVVRIEARADSFTASIDGNAPATATLSGTWSGGIEVGFDDPWGITSIPGPSGIDLIRVTDLNSGQTLFEDDFGDTANDPWTYPAGASTRRDGMLQGMASVPLAEGVDRKSHDNPTRLISAALADREWRDVAIEVRYRNVPSGRIKLRMDGDGEHAEYNFTQFQQMSQQFVAFGEGEPQVIRGPAAQPSRVELVRSMTAMALRPYPLLAAMVIAGTAIIILVTAAVAYATPSPLRTPRIVMPDWLPLALAWLFGTGLCLVAITINQRYSLGLPHWPDAVSYVFQAKIFASGSVTAPEPPVVPSFDYFFPTLTPVNDGRWSTVFPFGHPLLLSLGELVGAMWLVPALLAEFTAVLLFLVGRRLYGAGTAVVAAALFATSPFVMMQSSNFMSHSSAAFYLLAALALILLPSRHRLPLAVLAGVCFGLLFNTRPLSAAALTPAFALLLLAPLVRREAQAWPRAGAFAAGASVLFVAYFLYNFATTGDISSSNYQAANETMLGFSGAHSLSAGLQNDQTNLAYLLLVLHGWPQYVGLLFVLLPFALGTTRWADWWCLLAALPVLAAYTLFGGNGVMQGPRLWYEAVPFLMLLTARGGEVLVDRVSSAIGAWRSRRAAQSDDRALTAGRAAGLTVVYVGLGVLMCWSVYAWLLGRHDGWSAQNVPESAAALRGFDRIDDRMQVLLDQANVDNALVLVEPCVHWECYGSVFWMNSPSLDGNIVFAKNLPDHNDALFRAFPDREVYLADYEADTLVPFGATGAGGTPLASELLTESAAP